MNNCKDKHTKDVKFIYVLDDKYRMIVWIKEEGNLYAKKKI